MLILFNQDVNAPLPDEMKDAAAGRWTKIFSRMPVSNCISNSRATAGLTMEGQHLLPVMISSVSDSRQTWITSLYTQYVLYAREEADRIPIPAIRIPLLRFVGCLRFFARLFKIDNALHLNNYGVATNPWPDVPAENVLKMVDTCIKAYPDKSVVLRSLNTKMNAQLIRDLQSHGFVMVPSRIVYLLPVKPKPRSRDFRKDEKLLHDGSHALRKSGTLTPEEIRRCLKLYRMLYMEKYSEHNACYTERFLAEAQRSGFLSFTLLERNGIIDGVIAVFTVDDTLVCPFLGYDTDKPVSHGLYRKLSMAIYHEAEALGCAFINRSAGVGSFKKVRGARAYTEFSAIYCQHSPRRVRIFWRMLERICSGIIAPMVKKLKL